MPTLNGYIGPYLLNSVLLRAEAAWHFLTKINEITKLEENIHIKHGYWSYVPSTTLGQGLARWPFLCWLLSLGIYTLRFWRKRVEKMPRSFTATVQKIFKNFVNCPILPSNIFLLIKNVAISTLKAYSSIPKSDRNAKDVPKWPWGIYLKSQSIKCGLTKDFFR